MNEYRRRQVSGARTIYRPETHRRAETEVTEGLDTPKQTHYFSYRTPATARQSGKGLSAITRFMTRVEVNPWTLGMADNRSSYSCWNAGRFTVMACRR